MAISAEDSVLGRMEILATNSLRCVDQVDESIGVPWFWAESLASDRLLEASNHICESQCSVPAFDPKAELKHEKADKQQALEQSSVLLSKYAHLDPQLKVLAVEKINNATMITRQAKLTDKRTLLHRVHRIVNGSTDQILGALKQYEMGKILEELFTEIIQEVRCVTSAGLNDGDITIETLIAFNVQYEAHCESIQSIEHKLAVACILSRALAALETPESVEPRLLDRHALFCAAVEYGPLYDTMKQYHKLRLWATRSPPEARDSTTSLKTFLFMMSLALLELVSPKTFQTLLQLPQRPAKEQCDVLQFIKENLQLAHCESFFPVFEGAFWGVSRFSALKLKLESESTRLGHSIAMYELPFPTLMQAHISMGNYQIAIQLGREYLQAVMDMKTVASPQELIRICQALGTALLHEEKYAQSIEYSQQALVHIVKEYGEDHPWTASVYLTLGRAYDRMSQKAMAVEHYLAAIFVLRNMYGGTSVQLANIYNLLGSSLLTPTLSYKLALAHHMQAELILKSMSTPQLAELGHTYHLLAKVNRRIGNCKLAHLYYQEAYRTLKLAVPSLAVYKELQVVMHQAKSVTGTSQDINEYEARVQKAKVQNKGLLIAKAYNSLAIAHSSLGNSEAAVDCFHHVLQELNKLYRQDSDRAVTILAQLGNEYLGHNDYTRAIEYYERAKYLLKAKHITRPTTIASVYHGLGTVYFHLEKYKKGVQCLNRAMEIQRHIYGDNNPDAADLNLRLGAIYTYIEDYDKAISHLLVAARFYETVYWTDLQPVLQTYRLLGQAYMAKGDHVRAIAAWSREMLMAEALGLTQDVVSVSNKLANVYMKNGQYSIAVQFYKSILQAQKREEASNTVIYNNLAFAYRKLGNPAQASEYRTKSLLSSR